MKLGKEQPINSRIMEATLERERALLRTLIDNIPDSIYVKDISCQKILANARDLEYMGVMTEAEALGKTDFDFFPTELAQQLFADDIAVLQTGSAIINHEERFLDRFGKQQWLLTSKYPLHNENGEIIGLLGIGRDIKERKQAEQALQKAYDELEGRVEERTAELHDEINKRKRLEEQEHRRAQELDVLRATMTDISAELEISNLLKAVVERVVKLLDADFGELALFDEKHNDLKTIICDYKGKDYSGERTPLGEGALGHVAQTRLSLHFENYTEWEGRRKVHENIDPFTGLYAPLMLLNKLLGVVGVGASIARKFSIDDLHLLEMFAQQASIAIQNAHLYSEAQRLSITDSLTALYNRRYFIECAQNEFNRARRYGSALSIIMFDIDHFKNVNDTYGHLVGDKVLQKVAGLCRGKVRLMDVIARYGGEEFIILLPETNMKNASIIAHRLRNSIAQAVTRVEQKKVKITISLGLAELNQKITHLDTLLSNADTALYIAKNSGRNQVIEYETSAAKSA